MSGPARRGERKARWMIGRLDAAGVVVTPVRCEDGWGLKFPGGSEHTPEQRDAAVDAVMFGIGYPRCYGTMIRLLREREAVR